MELRHSPATVSDYRQSDFAGLLPPDRLKRLSAFVAEFRELTAALDDTAPVPAEAGRKADLLIRQMHTIVTQQ